MKFSRLDISHIKSLDQEELSHYTGQIVGRLGGIKTYNGYLVSRQGGINALQCFILVNLSDDPSLLYFQTTFGWGTFSLVFIYIYIYIYMEGTNN